MDDREYELKKSELDLKEREVIAREKEGKTSRFFSPVTIAIYVAAIGLFGNILTNILNNRASDHAEQVRAQSNLVLQVIKTNGKEDEACKNLNFFVKIGSLEDKNGAIHNACGAKGEGGVPTLPASSSQFDQPPPGTVATGRFDSSVLLGNMMMGFSIKVEDEESHQPIENATVEVTSVSDNIFGPLPPRHATTDSRGIAAIPQANVSDVLTVSKEGYETRGLKPLGQLFQTQTSLSTFTAMSPPVFSLRKVRASKARNAK